MTSILYATLVDDAAPNLGSFDLGFTVERLVISDQDRDISKLRTVVEVFLGPVSAFILNVGSGPRKLHVLDVDWEQQVLVTLRQSFALLTGAGRRFQGEIGGRIVVMLPSAVLGPVEIDTPRLVLFRAIVGLAEALRAELQQSSVPVSILFVDREDATNNTLAKRLTDVLSSGAMYSLPTEITSDRIDAYYAPLFDALGQTTAGQPLPDIGPMAAVYDLVAAGAPHS